MEQHLLVEHHLGECLPFLVQQLGDDAALQHVEMLGLGAVEDDNQSGAPV